VSLAPRGFAIQEKKKGELSINNHRETRVLSQGEKSADTRHSERGGNVYRRGTSCQVHRGRKKKKWLRLIEGSGLCSSVSRIQSYGEKSNSYGVNKIIS